MSAKPPQWSLPHQPPPTITTQHTTIQQHPQLSLPHQPSQLGQATVATTQLTHSQLTSPTNPLSPSQHSPSQPPVNRGATGTTTTTTPHAAQPQPQPSAPPPSRAEVERKLSVKTPKQPPAQRRKPQNPPQSPIALGSGNESDSSSVASSQFPLPPLITAPTTAFGNHFLTSSPAGSPATAHPPPNPVHGSMHGGLSAIAEAERQASLDVGDATEDADYEEGEDSEVDQGTMEELERGMEVKSGFLIKKQERRKIWKKKWFVLRGTKLAYYKDNREYSLSRAIDLRQVHSVVPVAAEKQKHPFAFAIVTSDRTFFVEALSSEERDDWIRAINSVRKRMSDREDEEARRREKSEAKAVPVPARQATQGEVDTHQGTRTSAMTSGVSTSPSVSGSYFHHRQNSSFQAGPSTSFPTQNAGYQTGSSYQQGTPFQPGFSPFQGATSPGGGAPQPSSSSNARLTNISTTNRSPSKTAAPPPSAMSPSAATVNRRLSNPIPVPKNVQARMGATGGRREASGGPPVVVQGVSPEHGPNASLSPPNTTPYFVSSDEDEAYFSDPHAAWQEPVPTEPQAPVDPNKVILGSYLMKKSRKTAREAWRKRWFFLTSTGITYAKNHMDARALTFIPLASILDVFSIETAEDGDDGDSSEPESKHQQPARRTSIRTRPPQSSAAQEHLIRIVTSKRRYDLCAPSEEEEIKWIASIRALINRERERHAGSTGNQGNQGNQNQNQGNTQASAAQGNTGPLSPRTEAPPPKFVPSNNTVPTIAQQPPTPASLPPASPTMSTRDYLDNNGSPTRARPSRAADVVR